MSSDSSEDENSELLREAVDAQFINDDMFNRAPKKKKSQDATTNGDLKNLPSLRPSVNEDDQFNMLGVSPQFQEHVAKRLSSMLEDRLQKRLTGSSITNVPQKRKKSGIKLFRNSIKRIKSLKSNQTNTSVRRPHKSSKNDSDSDIETKCSEVAVNPDDILSKKDVTNWSNTSKATVFSYKKTKSGTLTLQD